MKIPFDKYHGTGNDFIMIDDRSGTFPAEDSALILSLCSRRFGIGADGLILLQEYKGLDFGMVYFNADGKESSMCGNGGRCILAFARKLGIVDSEATFMAIDGLHKGNFMGEIINLQMQDVDNIEHEGPDIILDTGSPHYVVFGIMDNYDHLINEAKKIRFAPKFEKEGINVNYVHGLSNGSIKVRTYERGVEDETYSCGTGVVASAIASYDAGIVDTEKIQIHALGGILEVGFEKGQNHVYSNIWLSGPAQYVFSGEIESL